MRSSLPVLPAALAVKKATTTVPLGDGRGWRPGRHRPCARAWRGPGAIFTGLSSIAPDLEGEQLQLLREIEPALSHVAMFVNSLNPFHVFVNETSSCRRTDDGNKAATAQIYVNLKTSTMPSLRSGKERPDALLILADRVFLHNRERMMDFTREQRLPNVNAYRERTRSGGLMSYRPGYEDMHKRAAIYVRQDPQGRQTGRPADRATE